MSKSDSFLVLPPARTKATKHTDDSSIKSKTAHKTDKTSRSQSSKELISRFRERNRIEVLSYYSYCPLAHVVKLDQSDANE
jgi:hypothetical protein